MKATIMYYSIVLLLIALKMLGTINMSWVLLTILLLLPALLSTLILVVSLVVLALVANSYNKKRGK